MAADAPVTLAILFLNLAIASSEASKISVPDRKADNLSTDVIGVKHDKTDEVGKLSILGHDLLIEDSHHFRETIRALCKRSKTGLSSCLPRR